MKIKKSQLRRIIREELSLLLTETPQARRPWNWSHGSGKSLPEDWEERFNNLVSEIAQEEQWFTDDDHVRKFLSDIMFYGFNKAVSRPGSPWDSATSMRVREKLTDKGYMNSHGGWSRPEFIATRTTSMKDTVPKFTHEEIVDYLTTQASEYHRDEGLLGNPGAISELLRDDFMDNIGAYVELSPQYEELIQQLSVEEDPTDSDRHGWKLDEEHEKYARMLGSGGLK